MAVTAFIRTILVFPGQAGILGKGIASPPCKNQEANRVKQPFYVAGLYVRALEKGLTQTDRLLADSYLDSEVVIVRA